MKFANFIIIIIAIIFHWFSLIYQYAIKPVITIIVLLMYALHILFVSCVIFDTFVFWQLSLMAILSMILLEVPSHELLQHRQQNRLTQMEEYTGPQRPDIPLRLLRILS